MKALKPAAPGQGNLVPVTGDYILENREVLASQSVPLYRVLQNAGGELRAEAVAISVVGSLSAAERGQKRFLIDKEWKQKLFAAADPLEAMLEELEDETPEERAKAVADLKMALADLKNQGAEPMVKARTIMDTVARTFLLNKASLKLKPLEVTVHERSLAKDSTAIVTTALEMAEDPALVSGLFSAFQDLSNGQTINHVVRVFASYSGFLRYYNTQHQQRLSQTLRRVFPSVYRDAYQRLLPHLDDHLLNSDHLLQLPGLDAFELKEYALGAFLHDIGKMGNIDYFESDSAYDAQQIRQHVFLSAGLILMNYGNEHNGARLLAGDHHNALGHQGGYGVTRLERERGMRPASEPLRCLSGDSDGFVSGEALGWLPIEMLAVADVYDAMIDDSRAYKKPMTPSQAVVFLEDTMAAQGKLDPVLVDLYVDYLRAQCVEVPSDRGFLHKTGRGGEGACVDARE